MPPPPSSDVSLRQEGVNFFRYELAEQPRGDQPTTRAPCRLPTSMTMITLITHQVSR